MEDFTDHIRNDKDRESFALAAKNVNNALALLHANVGFGQDLKFRDPPPTLDQAMERAMPDLDDAMLTSR